MDEKGNTIMDEKLFATRAIDALDDLMLTCAGAGAMCRALGMSTGDPSLDAALTLLADVLEDATEEPGRLLEQMQADGTERTDG